jgi:single-stranded-DNA-specific exonuclease
MRILKQFAPFGPGNMAPTFMTIGLKDTGYGKCVGEDDKHIRLTATQSFNDKIVCIGFGLGDKIDFIKNKKAFSAAYSIDENHWNGNVSLQLKLKDIKP